MDQDRRRLWIAVAAACLVTAVLDGFQTYMQARIAGEAVSWRAVIWQGSEWLVLGALTPITYYLARRFPLRRPHLTRNVLVHLCGALVLCVGWAGTGVALRVLLGTTWQGIPLPRHVLSWTLISLPWSVFIYFAVLGCMHAFAYFVEARERETQAAQLEAQLAVARLGALRMQLHPHFLFNSLNAITVLVRDQRAAEATRMLELLSDVLRQVLRTDPSHEIALAEELRFLEQYLAIEQVRFSDRLKVVFAVDADVRDAAVPGFVLQPIGAFLVLRGMDVYGDPRPWSTPPRGVTAPSVIRFLNTTKYPASLLFLLMTLGPTIALIPLLESARGRLARWLSVFGRVPFFYYVLHIPLIHVVAVLISLVRTPAHTSWLIANHPMMPPDVPAGYMWSLALLYAVTAVVVMALYFPCRWFAGLKARRKEAWLSYL